jgi:hypothetical protein
MSELWQQDQNLLHQDSDNLITTSYKDQTGIKLEIFLETALNLTNLILKSQKGNLKYSYNCIKKQINKITAAARHEAGFR